MASTGQCSRVINGETEAIAAAASASSDDIRDGTPSERVKQKRPALLLRFACRGYTYTTFESKRKARSKIRAKRPNAIIEDIKASKSTGPADIISTVTQDVQVQPTIIDRSVPSNGSFRNLTRQKEAFRNGYIGPIASQELLPSYNQDSVYQNVDLLTYSRVELKDHTLDVFNEHNKVGNEIQELNGRDNGMSWPSQNSAMDPKCLSLERDGQHVKIIMGTTQDEVKTKGSYSSVYSKYSKIAFPLSITILLTILIGKSQAKQPIRYDLFILTLAFLSACTVSSVGLFIIPLAHYHFPKKTSTVASKFVFGVSILSLLLGVFASVALFL